MKEIAEKLEKIIDKKNIFENEPMKKHTSFKIGGVADYYVKVKTQDELKSVLRLAKEENIPYYIVGNGTNLLVRDGGFRGIIIKLEMQKYVIEKYENYAYIIAEAGVSLPLLSRVAMENGFSGIEGLAGVPGTLGGAVRMNAGAYGCEIKDVVISSKCMDKNGDICEFDFDNHEFSYRRSVFEQNEMIILETKMKFEYGKKEEIEQKIQEYMKSRKEKQPLEYPNAGSIFKRIENVITAKLIDECGLKGYSVGDAEVSKKHAGFIVNKENATAEDVLELIEYVKSKVKEKFDIDLELEVLVIGEK